MPRCVRVSAKNTPPEKETGGKTSRQGTESGAREQFLLAGL